MKRQHLLPLGLSFLMLSQSFAMPMKQVLQNTIHSNNEIKSLRTNSEAYKYYVDEQFGNYLPVISVDGYLEDKKSKSKNITSGDVTKRKQKGYNTIVKMEQTLYDGGLTPSKVAEQEHNLEAIKVANIARIEQIVYETIQAYLDTVKYKELELLSKHNIMTHEGYLKTAIESEEVSGETLDRLQVESKLLTAQSKYIKEKREADQYYATLSKLTGLKLDSQTCRPNIYRKDIGSLESLIQEALEKNYSISEELHNIEKQRAIINQEFSKFMPTLKARIAKEYDKDIDAQDIYKEEISARISLTLNLFNGLKDRATYLREKKFLQESQEKLDEAVDSVKEEIISSKTTYDSALERIEYLKKHIETTKNILVLTKEQFEGGTKTFLDVLNSEAELNRARKELIEEEYEFLLAYYNLLNLTAKLSDTLFATSDQTCQEITVDLSLPENRVQESDENLEELFQESGESNQPLENLFEEKADEPDEQQEIDKIYDNLMKDIYGQGAVKRYDKDAVKKEIRTNKEPAKAQAIKRQPVQQEIKKTPMSTPAVQTAPVAVPTVTASSVTAPSLDKPTVNNSEKMALREAELMAQLDKAQADAKIVGEQKEKARLAKLEEEKITAQKLEQQKAFKLKAQEEAKAESQRLVKLEEQRVAQQKAQEQKLAQQRMQQREAELMAQLDKAQADAKIVGEQKEKAKLAKFEEEKITAQKLEQQKTAKLKAQEEAKAESQRLAKLEEQRIEQQKAQEQKLAQQRMQQREVELMSQLDKAQANAKIVGAQKEKAKLAKLEEERIAAQKLEEQKVQAEKISKQQAEQERLAQLEKEKMLAKQKAESDRLAKLEEQKQAKINDSKIEEIKFASNDSKELIDNSVSKNLKEVFFSEEPQGYTLSISTVNNSNKDAGWFKKRYGMNDDVISYNLKDDGAEYIKVIHGVFDSQEEAQAAISSLHPHLQKNQPYVQKISFHKKLYNKYNQ